MLLLCLLLFIALAYTGSAFGFIGVPAQVSLSSGPQRSLGLHRQETLGGHPSTGSRSRSAITPEISAYVEGLLEETRVPGVSVGVVHVDGDSIVTEFGAWGYVTEDGNATKPEHLFSIGSCSKAFLASAVGILIDDFAHGRNVPALPSTLTAFTWDTKVWDLLPDIWAVGDEWTTSRANMRDILTHVSGLTRNDFSWLQEDSALDLILRMRYMRAKYELRQRWSYNNLIDITGAHIVSLYSGKPYTAFVKDRIFDPLNMSTTTYRWDEAEARQLFSHPGPISSSPELEGLCHGVRDGLRRDSQV